MTDQTALGELKRILFFTDVMDLKGKGKVDEEMLRNAKNAVREMERRLYLEQEPPPNNNRSGASTTTTTTTTLATKQAPTVDLLQQTIDRLHLEKVVQAWLEFERIYFFTDLPDNNNGRKQRTRTADDPDSSRQLPHSDSILYTASSILEEEHEGRGDDTNNKTTPDDGDSIIKSRESVEVEGRDDRDDNTTIQRGNNHKQKISAGQLLKNLDNGTNLSKVLDNDINAEQLLKNLDSHVSASEVLYTQPTYSSVMSSIMARRLRDDSKKAKHLDDILDDMKRLPFTYTDDLNEDDDSAETQKPDSYKDIINDIRQRKSTPGRIKAYHKQLGIPSPYFMNNEEEEDESFAGFVLKKARNKPAASNMI